MSPKWSWASTGDEVVREFAARVRGRKFLITGPSEGGIGAETALSLARQSPSTIILAGRDQTKVLPVIEKIRGLDSSIEIMFVTIDFANQDSIRSAAADIVKRVSHIDVLINNAAIMACPYGTTRDGLELQFGTNHVGHFLLTNLLLPKVCAAGQGARIVSVSSSAHRFAGIQFEDVGYQNGKVYDPWEAYGQSKTAIILAVIYLASMIDSKKVAAFSVHPGSIASPLQRYTDSGSAANARARAETIPDFELSERKSVQQGCATTLVAALDPDLTEFSGSYLNDGQLRRQAEHAIGIENAEKLWKLSERLVGQEFQL